MKSLLYIGNKLSKHGFNKTTVETLETSFEEEGYKVYSVSDKKSFFFRILDMIFTLIKLSRKIDYVLIDTYSTKAFWYAFFTSQLARMFAIKYIPILHGGNLPNRLQKNPFLSQLVFKNAYKNVAPSNYLKSEFEKESFTNVIYIPNTIEIEKYTLKVRKDFQPKLLWVRAFASIYNPEMAVQVLFELQKEYPNASLTMVGPDKDGSLFETQKKADDLGVKVTFTGQLSKETWWQLASEHDVFINTTHFDNTPISVMEAMALGLPVVSTNVGGLPYLLTDSKNALLVNDANVEEMCVAIKKIILNTSETILMTQHARELVEKMDWKVIKRQWNSLLQ
ncbi:glycosyltransferase family 4 protein [Flavobacterium jejuense]|uniref:Glycosyltransferase family 4 protein n=1 Tax=Flavobacterium jejuense TaxID=1544455 RepID=A0ABX0IQQ1_9FLAO|nr:glycosyltransferase family 4 protein [Flavobacterium jejuense]NHN26182.1 glycosyltransferase family 4 protein [Flavobacterium jejuense]